MIQLSSWACALMILSQHKRYLHTCVYNCTIYGCQEEIESA